MSNVSLSQTAKPATARTTSMLTLVLFFLPLGLASCLVTITHVIIHATLSQAQQPEAVIASYAIGMSLFILTERPAVLIRQTCSALVRDRVSFRAMSGVTYILIAACIAFGAIISYTPAGPLVFRQIFGVKPGAVGSVVEGYRFLMWVSVFSALRCLYHGVIISQMRTKWMTIGMVVRLAGMFALSQYFIRMEQVDSGAVGALIFAAGMMIEALVSFLEGRILVRKMPERIQSHGITKKKQVFGFYRPLLYSSFIAVTIHPAVNALLGKTSDIELAIASFAVASSIFNLVMSFFTYIHQIVLNFHASSPELVRRFQLIVGFVPGVLLIAIGWTPIGSYIFAELLGLSGRLLPATIDVLRSFLALAFVLPWLDFGNGLLMLRRRTNVFVWSQCANAGLAVSLLVILVALVPSWNGSIGAVAITGGFAGELAVVWTALYLQHRSKLTAL
ncbi:multi antimicrobial extrusion protein MatE [Paenibacillus alkalitolerans]|uniref:multi antimicrobial extrusion protein MatE n=1 Tax=Paenibacillus alkalitolerans TaxID=2799335 RepID=UPI0018F5BBF3|nr:multi antimicrobial extrusion protein MatE [Paenibacillus alkalitolerans]